MTSGQSGPFGGLSPQEAGKKSAKRQRLRRELADRDPQQVIIAKATEKALDGDVRAMEVLMKLNVLVPQTAESRATRGLLALLTQAQRDCLELVLHGEKVPEDLALEARCK
jgi:hypothetical protein